MKRKIWYMLLILWLLTAVTRADFALTGNQHLDVTIAHLNGRLYDTSSVDLLSSYLVNAYLYNEATLRVHANASVETSVSANHFSHVIVDGGSIRGTLQAYHHSTVSLSDGTISGLNTFAESHATVSGGIVEELLTCDNSNAHVAGGEIRTLYTDGSAAVTIAGGRVNNILAQGGSIIFSGQNFLLGEGLWSVGQYVYGTGILTGQWLDGTPMTSRIHVNAATTIQLIPEPCTLLLLGLGGLLLRKQF